MKIKRTKYWIKFIDDKKINKIEKRNRGLVYVFTGDGEGKTTAALGLGLRALGHGKTVVLVQFIKCRKFVGEYQVQTMLKNYEVYQFGKEEFVNLKNPDDEDRRLANEGLNFVREKIKEMPDILILDEINVLMSLGLVKVNDVLNIINSIPKNMILILTGSDVPKAIIKIADIVSEIKNIKHIFDYGIFGKKEL